MSTNDGCTESTSVRRRRVRGRLAWLMCVSDACANEKSRTGGVGARAKASGVVADASTARQNDPTLRYPSGTLTNTTPKPASLRRNDPSAAVATAAFWFE